MNIVVLVKLVPDLVEELSIDASGVALDMAWLRLIINEFDDHAVEQAILLKERSGGQVTVVAPEYEGVDDVLFTAAAKGADRLIKITGDFNGINNHALARAAAAVIKTLQPDLVLTGVRSGSNIELRRIALVHPIGGEYWGIQITFRRTVPTQDGTTQTWKFVPHPHSSWSMMRKAAVMELFAELAGSGTGSLATELRQNADQESK